MSRKRTAGAAWVADVRRALGVRGKPTRMARRHRKHKQLVKDSERAVNRVLRRLH